MEQFSTRVSETCGNARCGHERAAHPAGGFCRGNTDSSFTSSCSCLRFEPGGGRAAIGGAASRGSSRTYDESKDSFEAHHRERERSGFRATSSRSQIGGTGGSRPRPYLQGKNKNRKETPDWVMFGVDQGNGTVRVYASTRLSFLEMRQDRSHFDDLNQDAIDEGRITDTPWDLTGRMVNYIDVPASNYAEAIQMLFTNGWRPDGPTTADLQRQAALEDAQRAADGKIPEQRAIDSGGEDDSPAMRYGSYREPEPQPPVDEIVDAELVDEDE